MESPHDWQNKIIDKEQSEIDWENSQPELGIYRGKIVYYKTKDLGLAECPWHFGWIHYDPEHGQTWQATKLMHTQGWDFVRYNSDPTVERFVPHGIRKSAEGFFRYGDLVLMKVPMTEYLKRKMKIWKEDAASERDSKARFQSQVEKDGGQTVDPTPEDFAKRINLSR